MNQIYGQRFIIFKNRSIEVNYCWNYRPSKLLLHFTEYRLDQLNSNHTKIAVNSAIQYFEGCCLKKCLLKFEVFWSTHHKMRPSKIFVKLNGNHLLMANIFKLHKYQTFRLMAIHNTCKIWFANKIFSLWKNLVCD